MVTAFIGVGSNIRPEENVPSALSLLRRAVGIVAVSTFYRTEPVGRPEQPPFYNGVVQIETDLPAREMQLSVLRGIEARLGRRRTADRYAARPIDLDVLLYQREVIRTDEVVVPDPDIATRPFLAIPLHQLAPKLTMPDSGRPLVDLVAEMNAAEMVALTEFTERLRKLVE